MTTRMAVLKPCARVLARPSLETKTKAEFYYVRLDAIRRKRITVRVDEVRIFGAEEAIAERSFPSRTELVGHAHLGLVSEDRCVVVGYCCSHNGQVVQRHVGAPNAAADIRCPFGVSLEIVVTVHHKPERGDITARI